MTAVICFVASAGVLVGYVLGRRDRRAALIVVTVTPTLRRSVR